MKNTIKFILFLLVIGLLFILLVKFGVWRANYARASEITYVEMVGQYADKYDVSRETMIRIMNCENVNWDTNLQSKIIKNGIREDSWGLVQIFLPSHPEITKEQAINASFSISYLAENLSKGKGSMWSCF